MRPGRTPLRYTLREIVEPYAGRPDSTVLSLLVDLLILTCIGLSCVLVIFEWYYPAHQSLLEMVEWGFLLFFALEYIVRWYASANRFTYPFTLFGLLDLLAILPSLFLFAPEMMVLRAFRGAALLRMLRLLKLVRLLRFFRYGGLIYRGLVKGRIWLSAVVYQYNARQLGKLFLWALVVWFAGANILHLTETRLVGTRGEFGEYWDSYWNMLIVLISGIEDKEPISLAGRIEITVILIAGLVIVGMLTGEIVSMLVRGAQRAGLVNVMPPLAKLKHHIVILGLNEHVDNVIRQVDAGLKTKHFILVVDPLADSLPVTDARVYRRVFALAGDPSDKRILDLAGIDDASRVIVLGSQGDATVSESEIDNRSLMVTIAAVMRRGSSTPPTVVQLHCGDSLRYTDSLPEVEFVVERAFGEQLISQGVLNHGVTRVYDELMNFSGDSNEVYLVPVPEVLVGKDFQQAQLHFLDFPDEAVVPIGIDRSEGGPPASNFWICPQALSGDEKEKRVFRRGDKLIVLAYERPAFARAGLEEAWDRTFLPRS